MRLLSSVLYVMLFLLLLSSCSITRRVPDDKYLLNKSKIVSDDKNIKVSDLKNLNRQNPNRRILGVYRFHLRIYNAADYGKETRLKKWLKNTIGEPPVILDTLLINLTLNQHRLYLANKGYFNAELDKEIKLHRKKAQVKYIIQAGTPYTINDISYDVEDPNIRVHVYRDTVNSLIKRQTNYDVSILQKERERIANMLKNRGFFNFSREYIFFEADSALGNHTINLNISIKNPVIRTRDSIQSVIKDNHKRYIINNIYIYPQYMAHQSDNMVFDTTLINIPLRNEKNVYNSYNFISHEGLRINPTVLTQSIFFREGRFFNLDDVEQTYKRLSELKNFRFINIQFSENKDTLQDHPYIRMLDSRIELTRMPVHNYDIASDVTNSGGNLGIAGNLSYQNRNIFKNAEIFTLRFKGALEAQKIIGDENPDEVIEQLPFNTVETGINASLEVPKFFIPISPERFPRYFRPKTTINIGLNYQRRPDYERYISNTSFGYEWRESSEKTHMFNPIELNSVKITPDSSFLEVINNIKDKRLQLSYRDHLSMSMKYSFIYNTQQLNRPLNNFRYFRGNIETSGNLLRAVNKLFDAPHDEFGSYSLFNIRYAQFVRFDVDYRYYHIVNKKNSVVFRTAGGLGLPYGNLSVMPFDKSFFAGGANGIRAWKLYQLGPGGYSDTTGLRIYRTGDIHLEGNLEYRFDVYQYLKGALFFDAGNIWFRKESEQFPDAVFKFDEFYKQIAMGGGIGARLDFSFFIIRVDAAIPFRDPAKDPGQRWAFNNLTLKRVNFNLGIGYPF